jgi:hypothetical protein
VRNLDRYAHKDSSPIISFGNKTVHHTTISAGDSVEMAMVKVVRLSCCVVGCTVSYLFGSASLVLAQLINFTLGGTIC